MPADKLRALVNAHDRANARPHRLTGEPVLPERSASSKRRSCIQCWHVELSGSGSMCERCGGQLVDVQG